MILKDYNLPIRSEFYYMNTPKYYIKAKNLSLALVRHFVDSTIYLTSDRLDQLVAASALIR